MVIEPMTFRLRDGREAVLRPLTLEDARDLLESYRVCASETPYLNATPEEADAITPEGERDFIAASCGPSKGCLLGCFVSGALAGSCGLSFSAAAKMRHRASVSVAIRREFWGQGIGTAMFRTMIDLARAREGVLQLELDFCEGNVRARALYEKMGFRICGVKPDAIRLADGTVLNEYMMILKL